jgi:hypothetical protein
VIGIYLVDTVDIINITYDKDGVETRVVTPNVRARIAEKHRLILDSNGREVVGSMQVVLNADSAINHYSQLRIKTIAKRAYGMPDKEWQVKSLSTGHGFGVGFLEIWV